MGGPCWATDARGRCWAKPTECKGSASVSSIVQVVCMQTWQKHPKNRNVSHEGFARSHPTRTLMIACTASVRLFERDAFVATSKLQLVQIRRMGIVEA